MNAVRSTELGTILHSVLRQFAAAGMIWLACGSAACAGAICLTGSCAQAAFADEQFLMDGKVVPRSYYDAQSLVNDGTILLRSNRNKEAADKLAQAIQIAPSFAAAHHDYALALVKLGKPQDAIKEFKTALSLDPTLASAWLSLGGTYQSSGKLDDALDAYHEFLTRFPNDPDAPKIAKLVQGLQNLQLSTGATVGGAAAAASDYYDAAVRDGKSIWPASHIPVKVFIGSGLDTAGFKPRYAEILKQSFSDWAAASKGAISFAFVGDAKSADIECYWVSDPRLLHNPAEDGEARLTKSNAGLVHCTIQLMTIPNLPEMPMTENRMRHNSLHEIGHALGITGHTTDPRDAMFFSSSLEDTWKDLSSRDANTIVRLYSAS
jgi:tetratricopeptide (TPR) repeat protein